MKGKIISISVPLFHSLPFSSTSPRCCPITHASPIAAAEIFGTTLSAKWLSSVNRQQGNYYRVSMTNSHYCHATPPLAVPSEAPSPPHPSQRPIGSLNVVCILYLPSFYRSLFTWLEFAFWPKGWELRQNYALD